MYLLILNLFQNLTAAGRELLLCPSQIESASSRSHRLGADKFAQTKKLKPNRPTPLKEMTLARVGDGAFAQSKLTSCARNKSIVPYPCKSNFASAVAVG